MVPLLLAILETLGNLKCKVGMKNGVLTDFKETNSKPDLTEHKSVPLSKMYASTEMERKNIEYLRDPSKIHVHQTYYI